jgi:S-adenosyl methyltransferase
VESRKAPVGPPWRPSVAADKPPTDLHVDRPHPARTYDYLLGGKDNYPADREAAEHALAAGTDVRTVARQNRAFVHRAARFLTAGAGIRQFLDIGTGIPTSPNLHEVAQEIAPDARIVYVDNDR